MHGIENEGDRLNRAMSGFVHFLRRHERFLGYVIDRARIQAQPKHPTKRADPAPL